VAIQEVPDTEKIKHETNKIFLGFGASVIQRFYETWKIKPRFYFAGFLRFVCDMALSVRLKKVHGFYTVFSLFRTENCGLFCVFPTVFFPPRQDTLNL
jgi:hypothetical protein